MAPKLVNIDQARGAEPAPKQTTKRRRLLATEITRSARNGLVLVATRLV